MIYKILKQTNVRTEPECLPILPKKMLPTEDGAKLLGSM